MRTVRTVAELRAALAPERAAGRTVGLVPTMGFFHEGHLSLMRAARGENDVVVVSLFVNPTQFGPGEDLDAYPRDEQRDAALAEAEGVDLLFAPAPEEVYPDGFATQVAVTGLTDVLDGDPARRGAAHFNGVTTVVCKLLNMVAPTPPTSARRTPSRRWWSPGWRATWTCPPGSRCAPPSASPTAWP